MLKNRLDFYYQNVRGLRTKTKDFYLSTLSCNHDVVSISETNLCPSIFDSELFDPSKYLVYRCDRSPLNSANSAWGGVLLAVKSSLSSDRIIVPDTDDVEVVFVRINLADRKVYVACMYVPSGSDVDTYHRCSGALVKFFDFIRCGVNDTVFVMGDFNMTSVKWSPDVDRRSALLPSEMHSSGDRELICSLLGADLSQVNSVQNARGDFLDLIFSTDPDDVVLRKAPVPLSRVDRLYHEPIEFTFEFSDVDRLPPVAGAQFFDFKNADFGSFNEFFNGLDWNQLLDGCGSVDDATDLFYRKLSDAFERFVPMLTRKSTSHPPWYTPTVINLENRKSRAHKKWSKFQRSDDRIKYCALNREFESKQRLAYESYLNDVQCGLADNPRKFWRYVDSKKKTRGYPASMYLKEENATSPEGICSLFGDFFRSVYAEDVVPGSAFGVRRLAEVNSFKLTEAEVLRALRSIDVNQGDGPDDVSPLLVKRCSESLLAPLHLIFNLSLDTRSFPVRWKVSYLTPIHKSGSRNDIENYRGIAILPTLAKVFESLVCGRLAGALCKKLSRRQHGFLRGRSTSTNLMEFVSRTLNVIESRSQVDVVYTDIRKAFDRVRHGCLLMKLGELGFHPSVMDWIKSYLSDRRQCVKVLDYRSVEFSVSSGLPQGSHLGPLLFILYFNDVADVFEKAECSLFADDLKIVHVINDISDAVALQRDVDAFSAWCDRNYMSINVSKCKTMSFYRLRSPVFFDYSIGDVTLGRVAEMTDLGVVLDPRLDFRAHVDKKVAKAYSMLGFLKRVCADFTDLRCLTSIYNAHVRSHLEYASVVWSPTSLSLSKSIESIQKKFVIYALRRSVRRNSNFELPPYDERRKALGLDRLSDRRKVSRVVFMYDVLSGRITAPELCAKFASHRNTPAHSYRFRSVDMFRPPRHRTDYGFNEPVTAICRDFESFKTIYETSHTRQSFRFRVKSSMASYPVIT